MYGLCQEFLLMFNSTDIRQWNYFAAEQLIVYDIANYRWCANVERFHKSNNIMYVCFRLYVDSLKVRSTSLLIHLPLQDCC